MCVINRGVLQCLRIDGWQGPHLTEEGSELWGSQDLNWVSPTRKRNTQKRGEGGGRTSKDKADGCACITLQGAEILMALQAGFSSVINSHSIGSVPTGRTATINMTHSINWGTMGIVQTSIRKLTGSAENPPPCPRLPGRFLPSLRLGAQQPPQKEERRTGSVVPISFSLNKYPEHLLCSEPSGKKGGSRRDAVLPSKSMQSRGKAESNVMMSTQGVSVHWKSNGAHAASGRRPALVPGRPRPGDKRGSDPRWGQLVQRP